jgi:transketolase
VDAAEKLRAKGRRVRVVSFPCVELFERQSAAYREQVLPAAVTARVAVEAGVQQSWDRYLGFRGRFIGMHGFGASGPYQAVYAKFGITVDHVVAAAEASINAR